MDYQYKLNAGQYVLHDGDNPIGAVIDTVALAFCAQSGTLHKHGAPDMVQRWARTFRERAQARGVPELADHIAVIEGRIPVAELNRCLDTSGYILRLYARIQAGEIQPLALGSAA